MLDYLIVGAHGRSKWQDTTACHCRCTGAVLLQCCSWQGKHMSSKEILVFADQNWGIGKACDCLVWPCLCSNSVTLKSDIKLGRKVWGNRVARHPFPTCWTHLFHFLAALWRYFVWPHSNLWMSTLFTFHRQKCSHKSVTKTQQFGTMLRATSDPQTSMCIQDQVLWKHQLVKRLLQ